MKLVSSFHDFYDSAIHYSDEPLWFRKQSKYFIDRTKKGKLTIEDCDYLIFMFSRVPVLNRYGYDPNFDNLDYFVILSLAGTLYLLFKSPDNKPFEDIDAYKDYISSRYGIQPLPNKRFDNRLSFTQDGVLSWYGEVYNRDRLVNIHRHLQTPLFIIESKGRYSEKDKRYIYRQPYISENPRLLDYNLQTILHPWEVCQKIEMFLSNEMVNAEQDVVEFDDILKRDYHGMDEWSFKQKGPKKRKRK